MPVTVKFRGINLFTIKTVSSSKRLTEVLIPNALTSSPPETTNRKYHLDGSLARPHYAGVVIYAPDEGQHRLLSNSKVSIRETGGAEPDASLLLAHLPRLMSNELKVEKNKHKFSSVEVRGGTISVEPGPDPRREFEFAGLKVFDHVNVTFAGAQKVTLKIDQDDDIEFPPGTNAVVYVYNADDLLPNNDQLEEGEKSPDESIIDIDFKWLFLLLKPKNGTSLKEWSRGVLPCPISLDRNKTIAGSTCYPGAIEE